MTPLDLLIKVARHYGKVFQEKGGTVRTGFQVRNISV